MVCCVHVAAIRSLIKPLAGKSFAFGGAVSFVEPNSLRSFFMSLSWAFAKPSCHLLHAMASLGYDLESKTKHPCSSNTKHTHTNTETDTH